MKSRFVDLLESLEHFLHGFRDVHYFFIERPVNFSDDFKLVCTCKPTSLTSPNTNSVWPQNEKYKLLFHVS